MVNFLRTNYRLTGEYINTASIQASHLGKSCIQPSHMRAWSTWNYTSWAGDSVGTSFFFGGFIVGSLTQKAGGVASTDQMVVDSSVAQLSHFYGQAVYGNGYRILPIAAWYATANPGDSLCASIQYDFRPTMCAGTSLFGFVCGRASWAQDTSGRGNLMAKSESARLLYIGFVTSI